MSTWAGGYDGMYLPEAAAGEEEEVKDESSGTRVDGARHVLALELVGTARDWLVRAVD